MVRGLSLCVMLLFVVCVAGCATVQPGSYQGGAVATNETILRMQSKIDSLEQELVRVKDENFQLRKKVEELSTKEVRMPSGKEIQAALKKAGFFKGEVDGQIGPRTKEAVRKFQEANGITPDGVVGSRTWSLLSKYLP